jgi:hypothetical protein
MINLVFLKKNEEVIFRLSRLHGESRAASVLAFERSVGHAKIKLAVNTAYRPRTNESAKPSN